MTAAEKESAAAERRQRAFEEAVKQAAREILDGRLHGTFVLHAQAGLVVRTVAERSTKILT